MEQFPRPCDDAAIGHRRGVIHAPSTHQAFKMLRIGPTALNSDALPCQIERRQMYCFGSVSPSLLRSGYRLWARKRREKQGLAGPMNRLGRTDTLVAHPCRKLRRRLRPYNAILPAGDGGHHRRYDYRCEPISEFGRDSHFRHWELRSELSQLSFSRIADVERSQDATLCHPASAETRLSKATRR